MPIFTVSNNYYYKPHHHHISHYNRCLSSVLFVRSKDSSSSIMKTSLSYRFLADIFGNIFDNLQPNSTLYASFCSIHPTPPHLIENVGNRAIYKKRFLPYDYQNLTLWPRINKQWHPWPDTSTRLKEENIGSCYNLDECFKMRHKTGQLIELRTSAKKLGQGYAGTD